MQMKYTYNNIDEPYKHNVCFFFFYKHNVEWKKLDANEYLLYESTNVMFKNKQNKAKVKMTKQWLLPSMGFGEVVSN